MAAWAVATIGAMGGSLLLLLRRRLAVPFFAAALVCLALTTFHNFVLTDGLKMMGGTGPLIFMGVIIVVAVLEVVYACRQRGRGVLR